MRLPKRFRLLFAPVLLWIWLLGFVMNITGERKATSMNPGKIDKESRALLKRVDRVDRDVNALDREIRQIAVEAPA